MSTLPALLARRTADFPGWFAAVADQLLNRTQLVAGPAAFRPIEVEAYFHGPGHEDTFAHRHPVQRTAGAWYFHRMGNAYRGGSFKGVDLAFGDAASFGGFLFRGIEAADGTVVDGPSLLVDRLLKETGVASARLLDEKIAGRPAWDTTSPLHLIDAAPLGRPILTGPRVGLSMAKQSPAAEVFLRKGYRYLSQPRRTKKGRKLLVQAVLASGKSVEETAALTGSPLAVVRRAAGG